MTSGSPEPTLVLGLGNLVLADDAAGLRLLAALAADPLPTVEYVDGGTQGLNLLGLLEGRRSLLICDAVGLGAPPGTVHTLRDEQVWNTPAARPNSAHEGNAATLLLTARLLGIQPQRVSVVGIEPALLQSRIGLSPQVEAALPEALAQARAELARLIY